MPPGSTAAKRPRREPARSTYGAAPGVLALACGVALLYLAAPRIIAALYALPAATAIERLDSQAKPVPAAQLQNAQRALRLSIAWVPDGAALVDLARIELVLAVRLREAGQPADELLNHCLADARRGLALAPAQARGWLVLAEAAQLLGAPQRQVADYLLESIRASPYDIWLAINRAALAMSLWYALDVEAKALAASQIRLVAKRRGMEWVVRSARAQGDPGPAREAFADAPDQERAFEALYRRSQG